MVLTFDTIKGGRGSVRIGATGTISSLMSRELNSVKKSPESPKSSLRKSPTIPVSIPCVSRPKRQQPRRTVVNEASTSGSSSSSSSYRDPGSTQKPRSRILKKAHSIPMLGAEEIMFDNIPNRKKSDHKKGPYIVEVVDLKCRSTITHQLRKFSFSKLSQSII